MLPEPAQYLLRFDDLCPTIRRDRWRQYTDLIEEFHLRPILAVVPENRDPVLEIDTPDPEFWTGMRTLEASGAAIALHGYRHLCASRSRGLAGFDRSSEFAGVSETTQREWIGAGLGILRDRGLNPQLWVAPRHGFDRGTLRALRDEGISVLSDGLARMPFLCHGLTWIPQQLWAPVEKRRGLWTICIHPNTASDRDVENLRAFLRRHSAQFTSVDRVLTEFPPGRLGLIEAARARLALSRIRASRFRRSRLRNRLWNRS